MALRGDNSSVTDIITATVMDITTSASVKDIAKEGMRKMTEKYTLVDELNFIMCGIVAPIFCFVGMAGNVLSIITWNRPKMRSSTGRYLTGQAIADFAVLMFFVLIDSTMTWNPDVKFSPVYGFCFCYILYPGVFFAVVCSVWFTVGVTIDRYILVCWITKAKQYCNVKRANFGLILITVNAFIINFPHYLSFTTVDPSSAGNSSMLGSGNGSTQADDAVKMVPAIRVATFEPTEFYNGKPGWFYEFWIHCMMLIIVPWITVFSMNIMIIRAIRRSNKKNEGKKTSASVRNCKQSENQITRLLLVVTFTFLLFIGMQCVIQCMFMKKPAGFNMFIVNSSFAVAKCGIVFNSSTNFFLYCLTGRRFRTELLTVLRLRDKDQYQVSSLVDRPSASSSRQTTSSTQSTGI
ncbi:FMRFamide receptor [Elysia marginata]|uniref:FMRFamide receptor n=1 Tax=Elysia marginata TaxID=1093978 RepID=A0AAV4HYR3_9GAST|nr:FMRFamide receptor [Elysia marginata]